jgi:uncharacterized protein
VIVDLAMKDRQLSRARFWIGERTRLACWRKRPAFANFSEVKDCFGEPPKPTREPRVLPGMLRCLTVGFFLLAACCSFATELNPPKPAAYFNDYAGVVSKDAAQRFNEQLAQFERDTSNQVVVAVFPKMQSDSDVADYARRVAQAWGVGSKERRNGVVFLVFIADRKASIQAGYGLEGALPDITAYDIREYHVNPHFRNGDYAGGLGEGIDLIFKAIRGEYKGEGTTVRQRQTNRNAGSGGFVFLIIFVVVMILISRANRRRGYRYSSRGGPFIGGWSSGSGGWSSGGGGGGFSGFSGGGGSFGGGGSSGSW